MCTLNGRNGTNIFFNCCPNIPTPRDAFVCLYKCDVLLISKQMIANNSTDLRLSIWTDRKGAVRQRQRERRGDDDGVTSI